MPRNLRARYLIETSYELEKAAEIMAGEQSSGTFISIPGESSELKEKHRAHINSIEEISVLDQPSLRGAHHPEGKQIKQAIVELCWPFENVGANLSNLCATVAGNLFELKAFSGLRLLDIDIPKEFIKKYTGPKFSIEGTRKLASVYDRPIIGTIIKPSVGLTPVQTGKQVKVLIEAGLDFIKDDELMGDSPHSIFEERVDQVMKVINHHAQLTGKKAMYAFNISGDLDDMQKRHDYVLEKGGSCIMLSLNWVGISATHKIHQFSELPIHGHRNGWGMFTRCDTLGMEFSAYQKIWRLAGIDHLHTNGIRNKFCESDASVIKAVKSCLAPLHNASPLMPVLSSGQWAGQAEDTYKEIQSVDVMYVCGGGIMAHPSGVSAGVASIKQAWEAAMQGVRLDEYAAHHSELREALSFYGS